MLTARPAPVTPAARYHPPMRLRDKVAVITGGASGLGRETARAFVREGAKVVVSDIDPAGGEATVQELRRAGGDAVFVRTDVSKSADAQALARSATDHFGRIDVLYNNAGVQLHGRDVRAHELDEDTFDRTFAINVRGVWLCSKFVIPVMLRQGGGSIIHAASPTGLRAAPPFTAYSASKGAVIALTRTMAAEYAADNIRVNAIVPGATETPMIRPLLEDEHKRNALVARMPMGRLGRPEDVAPLVVFLASDESRFCTGGLYMADGGSTAM